MRKKGLMVLLILAVMACLCVGCGGQSAGEEDQAGLQQETTIEADAGSEEAAPDKDGVYDTPEEVALYLHVYGELPSNYITKEEAEDLGWERGDVKPYAPGKCIGGSHFGNYEGTLPEGDYRECDLNTLERENDRGRERLVYDLKAGNIYYTQDHYNTFEQLYDKEGRL